MVDWLADTGPRAGTRGVASLLTDACWRIIVVRFVRTIVEPAVGRMRDISAFTARSAAAFAWLRMVAMSSREAEAPRAASGTRPPGSIEADTLLRPWAAEAIVLLAFFCRCSWMAATEALTGMSRSGTAGACAGAGAGTGGGAAGG